VKCKQRWFGGFIGTVAIGLFCIEENVCRLLRKYSKRVHTVKFPGTFNLLRGRHFHCGTRLSVSGRSGTDVYRLCLHFMHTFMLNKWNFASWPTGLLPGALTVLLCTHSGFGHSAAGPCCTPGSCCAPGHKTVSRYCVVEVIWGNLS
jgi:hypothetical protein